MDKFHRLVGAAQLGGDLDLNAGFRLEAAAFQLFDARGADGQAVGFLDAGFRQRRLKLGRCQRVVFPDAGADILDSDLVVHRLVAHHQLDRRFGAAVKGRHIVQSLGFGVRLLDCRHSAFAYCLQLCLFGHRLGAAKNPRRQVKILLLVQRVLFLDQAHRAVGAVKQRRLVRLGRAGQQRALGYHTAELPVAQPLGGVGVAGAVVELQHAVIGDAVGGKIHHRQVARRDGRVLQKLLKNHTADAAG